MNIKIYACTHKSFPLPPDDIYVPLHVGRKIYLREHEKKDRDLVLLSYQGDDTGENISLRNDNFSELTGHYFIYKNDKDSDILGTCHYRRYLISDNTGLLLTSDEIKDLLSNFDIITTKELLLNFPYEEGFSFHHKSMYLSETGNVIKDIYPEYHSAFLHLIKKPHTYFGNMLIAKRELFNSYMKFCFDILFTLDKRIEIDEPDSYHRRIYGFISEFLLYLFVRKNELNAAELKVGMTSEKKEVSEIKAELKKYFKESDLAGARNYFLEQKKLRPDITMEASDITGELHLSMQIIATAGLEEREYNDNILNHMTDFDELIKHFNEINKIAKRRSQNEFLRCDEEYIKKNHVTPVSLDTAHRIINSPYI